MSQELAGTRAKSNSGSGNELNVAISSADGQSNSNAGVKAASSSQDSSNKDCACCCPCFQKFWFKLKMYVTPIIASETKIDHETGQVSVTIVPEACRVLFYLLFVLFLLIGITLTEWGAEEGWNDYDPDDNIMLNTFGYPNVCVYFDDPPFSYIAAATFMPVLIVVLIYIICDLMRVYFNEYENGKPNKFFIYYACLVGYFTLTVLCFVQVFATQPTQDIVVHHLPFMQLQIGLWVLGFEHFIYYIKIGLITKDSQYYWLGIVYMCIMGFTVIGTILLDVPNMFLDDDDKIWKQDGWEWTKEFSQVNNKLWLITVLVCPLMINFFFVDKLDRVTVTFALQAVNSINNNNDDGNNDSNGRQSKEFQE